MTTLYDELVTDATIETVDEELIFGYIMDYVGRDKFNSLWSKFPYSERYMHCYHAVRIWILREQNELGDEKYCEKDYECLKRFEKFVEE